MRLKLLIASFILLSFASTAQVKDGAYTYSNDKIELSFTISSKGYSISDIKFTYLATDITYSGKGEWFRANSAGGVYGSWYQFQAQGCYYEFDDELKESITLTESGCSDKRDSKEYILIKRT